MEIEWDSQHYKHAAISSPPYLGVEVAADFLLFPGVSRRTSLVVCVEALLLQVLVHCLLVTGGEGDDGELGWTNSLLLHRREGNKNSKG